MCITYALQNCQLFAPLCVQHVNMQMIPIIAKVLVKNSLAVNISQTLANHLVSLAVPFSLIPGIRCTLSSLE